ncbi:hypothetical protein M408DRAFT_328114 [Serendipita vermifera MAFF 305830]|uniref:Uncharacterized protein n=1 Tax=Serendipita vermifera MAFF 305830 TaxID=933852 RepID=A0A0C3B1A3_SERVB|nr:hypothetical protein M408DRAFT_328114 [Serendipita vermifera MAFF 305830]
MGKKRKIKEISDEERIQTVLIRNPYGYNEPDTWDAQDKKRRDDGIYVVVEWLEFIFGGLDGPNSSNAARRRHVPAVEMIFRWTGREELLVAISRDISLVAQLGRHNYSEFLRKPPRGSEERRVAQITLAKYEHEDQILGHGEGWKHAPVPSIEMTSIRRHKFAEPYPSPGISAATPKLTLNANEEKKNVKLEAAETKPQVKQEPSASVIKQEIKAEASTEDVKPAFDKISLGGDLQQVAPGSLHTVLKQEPDSSPGVNPLLVKQEPGIVVKEENIDDMIRRAQARREEERRLVVDNAATHESKPLIGLDSDASLRSDVNGDPDVDSRPMKRVKKEEPQ